jgi:hypothetical protein
MRVEVSYSFDVTVIFLLVMEEQTLAACLAAAAGTSLQKHILAPLT